MYDRIKGRYEANDIKDANGNIIVKKNQLINDLDALNIEKYVIKEVEIRSVLIVNLKMDYVLNAMELIYLQIKMWK